MLSRRKFLTYLGIGSYSMLKAGPMALAAPAFPLTRRKGAPPRQFSPIKANREDKLILPKGFRYDVIASYGDLLGTSGPLGAETFGFDADFTCFLPIDTLTGGASSNDGLLWVNHENPDGRMMYAYDGKRPKTKEEITREKLSVGGSIIHVQRKNGKWSRVPDAKYTKRFTALYPTIEMTGPAAEKIKTGLGTLGNCSGGKTPWNTILTCEENYHLFNPSAQSHHHQWATWADMKIDEQQYGWVVEIDPFGELPPMKHSWLGRFCHENACMRIGPTGRLAVYLGDDSQDQYFYKFVSSGKYDAKASRAERRKLLTDGELFVANFESGKWISLSLEKNPALKAAGYVSQADVLIHSRDAAKAVGATPLDRPEDCEIHPKDGSVYIALSNNKYHGNFYGQIVRLVEEKDNCEGESFRYEIFIAGGPQTGFSSPDNLHFDKSGNLWFSCDVGVDFIGLKSHELFGNNGFFFSPTSGPSAGDAFQFASAPRGAELTGPWFNPSEDTLFLSVQHPGEDTIAVPDFTSHWPGGNNSVPKPSVVAITGFR